MSEKKFIKENNKNENIEDEDSEKNEFFEFGAHFKYEDLYNKLNELKKKLESLNQSKNNISKNNIKRIPGKSRNIQLNNHIRSINIYLGDKNKKNNNLVKINSNKTSILPKTEEIKQKLNNQNEKISIEKKEKNKNFQSINYKKYLNKNSNGKKVETKSLSHPKKKTNLVTISLLLKNNKKTIN